MATVKAFIKTAKKGNVLCNVRFRLIDGQYVEFFAKSNLFVYSEDWDAERQQMTAKKVLDSKKRTKFNDDIMQHKRYILNTYEKEKEDIPKVKLQRGVDNWLKTTLDKWYYPEKYQIQKDKTFFDYFDEFASRNDLSEIRKKNLRVVGKILRRFERYKALTIDIDTFSPKLLREFEVFVRDEYKIIKTHPHLYEGMSKKRLPDKRSRNTVISILERFRPFFIWAGKEKYTKNDPFIDFEIGTPTYGTPIYITSKERDTIMDCDLSDNPPLAIQRDIFVFQCLVGCRVSDLLRFKKANVLDGVLYYIAHKTASKTPVTIQVPLSANALRITERYKDCGEQLLPFISNQKYNDAIKEVFERAGITRLVTWLNPQTNKGEQRPINEIASSHMARRTFVGNLYAKVKDPNLVGALSGHAEGSKAFARYREIDLEMKKELINLLGI